MKKLMIVWIVLTVFAPCASFAAGESVTLVHVDGLTETDSVGSGMPIVFHIRMTFGDDDYWGISNGFRVYSPDSVEWDTTIGAWSGAITDSLLPYQVINYDGVTGSGADTTGFAAFMWMEGSGIPPYFDDTVCTITIGPIDSEYEGGTICLDSSFYRPTNVWKWASDINDYQLYIPAWDGPHCFVVTTCCQLRGDIDHDGQGPYISDLMHLIAFMYQSGPPPPCMEEADVNDSGGDPDMADLVYLQSYMFGNPPGPAPVPCP